MMLTCDDTIESELRLVSLMIKNIHDDHLPTHADDPTVSAFLHRRGFSVREVMRALPVVRAHLDALRAEREIAQ